MTRTSVVYDYVKIYYVLAVRLCGAAVRGFLGILTNKTYDYSHFFCFFARNFVLKQY